MDTQSPTYSDDELTAALAGHLASLERDDSYRVNRVLKHSDVETTELVYFEGSGGGSLGPFVRKRIDASAQIGGAYERLFAAQHAGRRYEHLPRIVDCRRVGRRALRGHGIHRRRNARGSGGAFGCDARLWL